MRAVGQRSTVHEKIFSDLALLRVQFKQRSLQDAITIDAAWINGERSPHFLYTAALVYVAMNREHGLIANDCVPYGLGSDRFHHRSAADRAERGVQGRRLVKAGSIRRGVEIEDGAFHVRHELGDRVD